MDGKARTPEETYGPALEKATKQLGETSPQSVALRTDVEYRPSAEGGGVFRVPFLGSDYLVRWPDGFVSREADGTSADISTRLVLLHYLLTSDGTPVSSQWIAFRSLPGGMGYEPAFRPRANQRLAVTFGSDREGFVAASRSLQGLRLDFGDAAFEFAVLPRLSMAVVLHLASDEFPADANVLFDASASHYLPTEDLAVLGGMLTSRLVKASRTP